MRKLLAAPVRMSLTDSENSLYQNMLKHAAEISLNLMAVKVEQHPDNFLQWSQYLLHLCKHGVNQDLLDQAQFKPFNKLQDLLSQAISISQLKMLRITPWPIFAQCLQDNAQLQSLDERLALLNYVENLRATPLAELSTEDLLAVAGKHMNIHSPNHYQFDIEWFASTKAANSFHQLLKEHTGQFDTVMANIPLSGEVTTEHYANFVTAYKGLFETYADGDKAPLAPATRLLAMRRPDCFVALTKSKMETISHAFGMTKLSNQSFDDYWYQLTALIQHCPWWKSVEPEQTEEQGLWQNRAILVDLFFYASDTQANESNFVKLRDKPAKSVKMPMARAKRTAATAESIVDKALENDELPAYMQEHRGAIINSVKNGKTAEQAIGLLRTIFG